MTNDRFVEIRDGLIGSANGSNTTRGYYTVLMAVKGEMGKLYATDMPLLDRKPVTQAELGEALAILHDDKEYMVGGSRY